jgi:hypothetical protein
MNKDYSCIVYEDAIVLTHAPSNKKVRYDIEYPWGRKVDIVTQMLNVMGFELKVDIAEPGVMCPEL